MIERSQKILIVREKLSQFLSGCLIQDQTVDTLRPILISLVSPKLTDTGATVRVDGATAFQERDWSLQTQYLQYLLCNSRLMILGHEILRVWQRTSWVCELSDQWSKHFTARLRNRDPSEEERNKSNLPIMLEILNTSTLRLTVSSWAPCCTFFYH